MKDENKQKINRRRLYRTAMGRFFGSIRERFDLGEDSATQAEVVASITKSVEFKGTNLWVLICATFIASLGLNVNSTAVIIGAMLVSPLMGPIMGIGLSLGINDFQLLKKSLRNFMWMFVVSIVTSSVFFMFSPYSSAQSELLARTSPTTYDVLIAFFGGLAGMLAQTRRDRTGTVISGVAIATALMPPLCTAGFGIASGEPRFIFGALYLFLINAVFIAVASYLVVAFLKYEKAVSMDEAASKRMHRYVLAAVIIVIVPSIVMTFNIFRKTQFEANVDRYVTNVFQFNKTMLVDYSSCYRYDGVNSSVEVSLVGEPLSQNVIESVQAQLLAYGLENTTLEVRQADEASQLDLTKIQKSYSEIIDEKNRTIQSLESRLAAVRVVDTIAVADISREIPHVMAGVGSVSMAKHIAYDTKGVACDTTVLVTVTPATANATVDTGRIQEWLRARLKNDKVVVYVVSPKAK